MAKSSYHQVFCVSLLLSWHVCNGLPVSPVLNGNGATTTSYSLHPAVPDEGHNHNYDEGSEDSTHSPLENLNQMNFVNIGDLKDVKSGNGMLQVHDLLTEEESNMGASTDFDPSSKRKKRWDPYHHEHCYGGEWKYKAAYWAHGHWHNARWIWQRPHCHFYHEHDKK